MKKNEEFKTRFEHFCELNPSEKSASVRMTGIICTISHSTTVEQIVSFLRTGMNIARLDFSSNTTHEEFKEVLVNIKKALETFNKQFSKNFPFPLAIAVDTMGPEVRTGCNTGDCDIELENGDIIKITVDKACENRGTKEKIYINCEELPKILKPDNEIYIDNGMIILKVKKVVTNEICCSVECGGTLSSKRIVHLPCIKRTNPLLSDKDKADIRFAMDNKLDFLFASNVKTVETLKEIRKILCESDIKIISKIDSKEGVENIDAIITDSYGILISRVDLGLEIPSEKVPVVQKMIVARCNKAGKPCLLSSQLLESMLCKPKATRSEISDVANVVFENFDCAILNEPTANGNYRLESILAMSNILLEAEASMFQRNLFEELVLANEETVTSVQAAAMGAVEASMRSNAACIVVLSPNGVSAQLLAKYRPKCPIIAVTNDEVVARQMQIHRGVLPLYYKEAQLENFVDDVIKRVKFAIEFDKSLKNEKKEPLVKIGDRAVVLGSLDEFKDSECESVRVMEISA